MMEFIAVPAIVVICYFIGYAVKTIVNKESVDRLIPVICGLAGAILGVLAFIFCPAIIVATDIFTAIATGIVSGLSATGVNQIVKQISKYIKE